MFHNKFYLFLSNCWNAPVCTAQRRLIGKKRAASWLSLRPSPEKIERARKYLEELSKTLNFTSLEDFHKLRWENFRLANMGRSVLKDFENSVPLMLLSCYPEYDWKLWKFKTVPMHIYNEPLILRRTLDQIGSLVEELGNKTLEDWYDVKKTDFIKYLKKVKTSNASFYTLLTRAYPEHPWSILKFRVLPRNFMMKNIPQLFREAAKELGIQNLDDWYAVSINQLSSIGLKTLVDKVGMFKALQIAYPEHYWNKAQLFQGWKTERYIFSCLKQLFPNNEVLFQQPLESFKLDAYIPDLKIAFEYQGLQHYKQTDLFGPTFTERDNRKKQLCGEQGITLIEIPYWWDNKIESLKAQIHKYRRDIVPDSEGYAPIPEYPPERKRGERKGTKRVLKLK